MNTHSTTKAVDSGLFDLDAYLGAKPKEAERLTGNLWTHQKAMLISRYLWQFLAVTKNGIYIDAFAGPQEDETKDASWAAKQVLGSNSHYLGRACLFEKDATKIPALKSLQDEYCQGWTKLSQRQVMVTQGDCNIEIPAYLKKFPLKSRQACFALLDQRTHECSWDLVKSLSGHKTHGSNKIETFYFLAQGWMNRSVKSAKNPDKLEEIRAWWGRDDWSDFISRTSYERAEIMEERFRNELGYRYTKAFPMKQRGNDGGIMFWLIHGSDHPRAIPLMASAYRSIGLKWNDETWRQCHLDDLLEDKAKNSQPSATGSSPCS